MDLTYLDNSATTCASHAVALKISEMLTSNFGNPSSLHTLGVNAYIELEKARGTVAKSLLALNKEIVFTSGGTESNNMAILGAAYANSRKGNRIVTSLIEHPSVLEAMAELEKNGFEVIYLKPDITGAVPTERLIEAIDDKTVLVSLMAINNETGAFQPIEKVSGIIKSKKAPALFHCDAVQRYGKYEIAPKKLGIDLLSISAHKVFGPKGVGALYIKDGVKITARSFGGSQERGLRAGTECMPLIAGFGVAVSEFNDLASVAARMNKLKSLLMSELVKFDDIVINSVEASSDYILNFSIHKIKSEILLHYLEAKGIFVSSGSACKKGKDSHVLLAQGLSHDSVKSAIRVSFCKDNTEKDVEKLVSAIETARKEIIRRK